MIPRILAMILFALALAAGWIVWHPIALPESRVIRSQDDDWRLPDLGKPDSEALVAKIELNRLWGTDGMPLVEEKPLTAPNWRIAGVVSTGAESYAMLQVEGQPPQQVKTGEKLPGGAKIVNMTADRVCILLNGKRRMLRTIKE